MTTDHVSSENGYSIASSTEDRGLESLSYQTKNYKTGICCFSTKHAAIRRKGRDLLVGIRIICSNGETCILTDYYYSEIELLLNMKYLKNCLLDVKQQSLTASLNHLYFSFISRFCR